MGPAFRRSAVMLVAAALATGSARAAAVQPATHAFVKGEHFIYTTVIAFAAPHGEGVIGDGPSSATIVEYIDVTSVSASEATLAYHLDADTTGASDYVTGSGPAIIHARRDGTWLYDGGHAAQNLVTWDTGMLGPQPRTLTPGQHWTVDFPRGEHAEARRSVVRVVSASADNIALHVQSRDAERAHDLIRMTNTVSTDVAYEHGILRELHVVWLNTVDAGPGTRGSTQRMDRRTRLTTHTTP